MGWALNDRAEEADHCPYLSTEHIDPKWLEASGGEVSSLGAKESQSLLEARTDKDNA